MPSSKQDRSSLPGCEVKARFVLAALSFFVTFNLIATSTNMSVAIVAMVNSSSTRHASVDKGGNSNVSTSVNSNCPERSTSVREKRSTVCGVGVGLGTLYSTKLTDSVESRICLPLRSLDNHSYLQNGVFDWDRPSQGTALGFYFYGYAPANLPGAWLAHRFGFAKAVGVSLCASSLLTFVTPAAAYAGFHWLGVVRVLIGIVQALILPSLLGSWGVWAPESERSTLLAVVYAGMTFGACATVLAAGVIAENLGWEAVFYVTGSLLTLCTILWLMFAYESPESHPRISENEKEYIMRSNAGNDNNIKGASQIPWKNIFTSPPLLVIYASHFAANWSYYTLLSMLPTYMFTVLGFDLAASGFLSALPFVLEGATVVVAGYVTDVLRNRGVTSTKVARKVNTAVGMCLPALFVVWAGYVGCDAMAAVVCFSLAQGFFAFTGSGNRANAIDVTPGYAGIVFGISNAFAVIPGFLAPLCAGLLLQDDDSIIRWQIVFWMCAAINVFGALTFLLFSSGEEQQWAKTTKITDAKDGLAAEHEKFHIEL